MLTYQGGLFSLAFINLDILMVVVSTYSWEHGTFFQKVILGCPIVEVTMFSDLYEA